MAAKYSLQNQLERYSFNSRWSRAVQKAYSSASQNSINIGSFSFGSTCTRVSVENAAELLLFIMFVTDPTFMLIESSRNNSTIAEIKEFSEKYLGFWDLKLFMLERKYLQMIEEQKNEEIKEHLAKCTQGRKTF